MFIFAVKNKTIKLMNNIQKLTLKEGLSLKIQALCYSVSEWDECLICAYFLPGLYYTESMDIKESVRNLLFDICDKADDDKSFSFLSESDFLECIKPTQKTVRGIRLALTRALREHTPPYFSSFSQAYKADVCFLKDAEGNWDYKISNEIIYSTDYENSLPETQFE